MEKNKTIHVSDEIAEFIKNHNQVSVYSKKLDKRYNLHWDHCKYIETEDPNVFEVIYPNDELGELLNNRLRLDEASNNN